MSSKHYLDATFSSSLPVYIQPETRMIRKSSHPQKREISPYQILPQYFSQPEYVSDELVKNVDEDCENASIGRIGMPTFISSSRLRQKFEDLFENPSYEFPRSVLGPSAGTHDLAEFLRKDFSNDQKFACGRVKRDASGALNYKNFRPRNSDQILRIYANGLFRILTIDWATLKFGVSVTQSDDIVITFELDESLLNVIPSISTYLRKQLRRGFCAEKGLKKGSVWENVLQKKHSREDGTTVDSNPAKIAGMSFAVSYSLCCPWNQNKIRITKAENDPR